MAMGKAFDDQEEDVEEFEAEADDDTEADAEESEGEVETSVEAASGSSNSGSRDEVPEERTVASRQKQREEMAREIEEFLARGGKISQIEPNVTADPPRKPDSDYGSRPI